MALACPSKTLGMFSAAKLPIFNKKSTEVCGVNIITFSDHLSRNSLCWYLSVTSKDLADKMGHLHLSTVLSVTPATAALTVACVLKR